MHPSRSLTNHRAPPPPPRMYSHPRDNLHAYFAHSLRPATARHGGRCQTVVIVTVRDEWTSDWHAPSHVQLPVQPQTPHPLQPVSCWPAGRATPHLHLPYDLQNNPPQPLHERRAFSLIANFFH